MRPGFTIRIFALLMTLALANCAINPVTGNSNLALVSESEEIRIGSREDTKVRQQYGVYDNPALQQYVNDIGQRLVKASHRPQLEYHFLVVDSPDINAFALPGGYIYITRGILAYLNSEAELAAVLGHELGHVTARHSVQQISATTAANIGVALLGIFVPQINNAAGDLVVNLFGGALLSGYGREHELEADRLGAEYLARTGYDPQAMVKVVSVLKNQEVFDAQVAQAEGRQPRAYHGVFASHPDNDTRLQQVVGEAARYQQAATRNAREEFLRKIDRMVFADSPRQGVLRNNDFYHAELGLALRFPPGWRVQNRPQNVVAHSPQDDALIELAMAGPAQGSPPDVLRRFARLGSGAAVTPTTINGLPAAIAATNMRGLPTRIAVVFLEKTAYVISAQARSAEAMSRHMPEISAAQTSFHAITDGERALAWPLRLRMITAREGMTFTGLARTSALGRNAEEYLRLINAMYPTGEPVAGQALKIVE